MRLTLPVTIFGIDSEGERFTALAMATNLSRTGALLTGFDVELRCGDTMVVENEGHRAQFRTVWVLNLGPVRGAEVALHKFEGQPCPWEDRLPEQATLAGSMSRSQ